MSRDQRIRDNWALWYAQTTALERKSTLLEVFCLRPTFLGAGLRQYSFMIKGLQEVEITLGQKNIPFDCLFGDPRQEIPHWIRKNKVGCLITDFDPSVSNALGWRGLLRPLISLFWKWMPTISSPVGRLHRNWNSELIPSDPNSIVCLTSFWKLYVTNLLYEPYPNFAIFTK
jgi:DNA photolyase